MAGWLSNEYDRWLLNKGIIDPSWHHYWNKFLEECHPHRLELRPEVKEKCKKIERAIKEKASIICSKHNINDEHFKDIMIAGFNNIEGHVHSSLKLVDDWPVNPGEELIFKEAMREYDRMPLPVFKLYGDNDPLTIYYNNNKDKVLNAVEEISNLKFDDIVL